MKRIWKIFGLTAVQCALIASFYLLVLLILVFMDGGVIFRGITPSMISGEIDYRAFSRWLLLMSAPILADGYLLLRIRRVQLYLFLRMQSRAKWHYYELALCLANTLLWSVLLLLGILYAIPVQEAALAWLLLFLNGCIWLMLTLILYIIMKGSPAFGVFVILLLGMSFLLGEFIPGAHKWAPGAWSMLCRTSDYWASGGSVFSYATASAVLALAMLVVFSILAQSNTYKEL